MKQALLLSIAFFFLMGCTPKKNTYNTIEFTDKEELSSLRTISLYPTDDVFQMKPIFENHPNEKGVLLDTFSLSKPGFYLLHLTTANTTVYLEKGDLLKINFTSSPDFPSLVFDGDHKDANEFIFGNSKIVATALNEFDATLNENNSETKLVQLITKTQQKSEHYCAEHKSKINDTILHWVQNDTKNNLINLGLFYKYKLSKFTDNPIHTPQLDHYIQKFNGADIESFHSSSSYRSVLYEFHKFNFKQVSNKEDLLEFHDYLIKKTIPKEIQDYLLSIYATNYCITEYSSYLKQKQAYDYLMKELTDTACKNYIYTAYLKASKRH
jgi:hypothetical protein